MNSRLVAAKIIFRVIKQGQSLTSVLDNLYRKFQLLKIAHSSKRFVTDTTSLFSAGFYLNQLLHKPLKDEEIRMLALIGLYQLKYMRVKEHAAVSETVAAANKKLGQRGC